MRCFFTEEKCKGSEKQKDLIQLDVRMTGMGNDGARTTIVESEAGR